MRVAVVAAKLVASEVVTDGKPAATVKVSCFSADCVPLESVTLNPKVALPTVVGIPEITPVVVSKLSPPGINPVVSAHDVYVPVPPFAAILNEYEVPIVPFGKDNVSTATVESTVVKLEIDETEVPTAFVADS